MKKILLLTIIAFALALPTGTLALCQCVCSYSGCGADDGSFTRIQTVADQPACDSFCDEADVECDDVSAACREAGTLPTSDEDEEPAAAGSGSADLSFEPPLGTTSIEEVIGRIIQAALGIVGSIALLMFVAGGFVWMTAAGNQDRVNLGKNILIWSTLGLVVIFSAYAITRFVLSALLG